MVEYFDDKDMDSKMSIVPTDRCAVFAATQYDPQDDAAVIGRVQVCLTVNSVRAMIAQLTDWADWADGGQRQQKTKE